jgi:DNA-binding NarL/FixJ family response regulator
MDQGHFIEQLKGIGISRKALSLPTCLEHSLPLTHSSNQTGMVASASASPWNSIVTGSGNGHSVPRARACPADGAPASVPGNRDADGTDYGVSVRLSHGTRVLMVTVHEEGGVEFRELAGGVEGLESRQLQEDDFIEAVCEAVPAVGLGRSKRNERRPFLDTALGRNLSRRETEVLELLAQGDTYNAIAARLRISYSTAQTYLARLYKKLRVTSRGQAVARYLQTRQREDC